MYLVAQKVRSPRGDIGINVVAYRHVPSESDAAHIDWEEPDLRIISSEIPGERTAQIVNVAPGGNGVVCYLDVAAREGTRFEVISQALDQLAKQVGIGTRFAEIKGAVAAEFRTTMGSSDEAPHQLRELREKLLLLLSRPELGVLPDAAPLRVTVSVEDDRWKFTLDPRDQSRVPSRVPSITVPFDVADDFKALHGDLYPHVAEWLTGLPRKDILDLGGVNFIGAVSLKWPAR